MNKKYYGIKLIGNYGNEYFETKEKIFSDYLFHADSQMINNRRIERIRWYDSNTRKFVAVSYGKSDDRSSRRITKE